MRLNPRLSNLTCGAHFFLLFFFKSNIHENHTFKGQALPPFYFIWCSILWDWRALLYFSHSKWLSGPQPSESEQVTISRWKKGWYKQWNHLWHPWNGPEAIGGESVRTVCVFVCVNACFAPPIMPQLAGARGYGKGGEGSCDWLMCCSILSESIYRSCLLMPRGGGWGGGGTDTWKHLHVYSRLKITFDLRFIYSYRSHVYDTLD